MSVGSGKSDKIGRLEPEYVASECYTPCSGAANGSELPGPFGSVQKTVYSMFLVFAMSVPGCGQL